MEIQKREGWRIRDWCHPDVRIFGEPMLYKLWREGKGPRHVRIGGITVITESPGEYLSRVAREPLGAE